VEESNFRNPWIDLDLQESNSRFSAAGAIEIFEISCSAEARRIRVRQTGKITPPMIFSFSCFEVSEDVTGSFRAGLARFSDLILAKKFDIGLRKFAIRFDNKEYNCCS
jgi:hypothetical protein